MNRVCLLLLAGLLSIPRLTHAAPKPNLIVILADDLGWADLGCYGNTFNETPHIDRLAREGMRFTQFYAGPVCSPTRCNLQSGQDQARFGITQHIPGHKRPFAKLTDPAVPPQLPLEVETFAECLAKAGYSTAYFGKWHLGGEGFGPENQGWQEAEEIKGHTVTLDGTTMRGTEHLADRALAFIEKHKSTPFLLQLSPFAVHIPLTTTSELKAKYAQKAPMSGYPSIPQYAGLLEELDRCVGRVVEGVEKAGIANHTLILFLSDNGGLEHEQSGRVVTSNHPLRGEKGTLYEGGIRIPAIARWPGNVPAGSRCDTPLVTMDVFPTLVELAGVTMPKTQPCDGISLATVLRDPAAAFSREMLHWHLPHYHHSTPAGAIRRGDWKLIEFFEHGTLELYDLKDDPGEKTNLVSHEQVRAKELQVALAAWRREIDARMPMPNPDHDPARASELAKGDERKKKP